MDWEPLPAQRVAELVSRDLAPGAVVLLHDSVRYAHRPSTEPTAQAVRLIANAATERDVTLQPLGVL